MAFSDLTTELQNILLINHGYLMKWTVFLLLIFLSLYYIFIKWPKKEKTVFFSVYFSRMVTYVTSIVILFTIPVSLLILTPEYSWLDYYGLYYILFKVYMGILFPLLFVDLMRYGFTGMLEFGGFDTKDPNSKKVVKNLISNINKLKIGFGADFRGGRFGK